MATVYVNIGSNLGNRRELILKAIDAIADIFGYYCLSGFVESDPWGFVSANPFLNIGMAFLSDLKPEEILDRLQEIERSISSVSHRDANGDYKDREIDIDIMAIDNIKFSSPRLSIPHKHLHSRPFFLIPLRELIPNP